MHGNRKKSIAEIFEKSFFLFQITVEFIVREYKEFVTLRLQCCVHKSLNIWRGEAYKESDRFMFHLLIKVGILPFYMHRFFKFNLKPSSRRVLRILKQSGALDVRQNITSISTGIRKVTYHTRAKPFGESVFHVEWILDFESSEN